MSAQTPAYLDDLIATGDFVDIKPLQVAHTASGSAFWTGTLVATSTPCFIKRYPPTLAQDALREIEFTRAIAEVIESGNYPGIGVANPIQHYTAQDGSLILVTKFLRGMTLEEIRVQQTPFDLPTAQLVHDGLMTWAHVFLNVEIAHRDVCPKNFMIAENKLILIDFQTAIKKENPVYTNPTIKQIKSLGGLGSGYSPKRGQWNDVFSLARVYEEMADLMPLKNKTEAIQILFSLSRQWTTLQNDFVVTPEWKKKIKRDYLKVLLRPAWTCKPLSRSKRAYVLETVQRLLKMPD